MPEKTFRLEVLSPAGVLYSQDVLSLVARGTEGFMGVLPGHAPLLTGLEASPLKIVEPGDKVVNLPLSGGFMEIKQNKVVILTDTAEGKGRVPA